MLVWNDSELKETLMAFWWFECFAEEDLPQNIGYIANP